MPKSHKDLSASWNLQRYQRKASSTRNPNTTSSKRFGISDISEQTQNHERTKSTSACEDDWFCTSEWEQWLVLYAHKMVTHKQQTRTHIPQWVYEKIGYIDQCTYGLVSESTRRLLKISCNMQTCGYHTKQVPGAFLSKQPAPVSSSLDQVQEAFQILGNKRQLAQFSSIQPEPAPPSVDRLEEASEVLDNKEKLGQSESVQHEITSSSADRLSELFQISADRSRCSKNQRKDKAFASHRKENHMAGNSTSTQSQAQRVQTIPHELCHVCKIKRAEVYNWCRFHYKSHSFCDAHWRKIFNIPAYAIAATSEFFKYNMCPVCMRLCECKGCAKKQETAPSCGVESPQLSSGLAVTGLKFNTDIDRTSAHNKMERKQQSDLLKNPPQNTDQCTNCNVSSSLEFLSDEPFGTVLCEQCIGVYISDGYCSICKETWRQNQDLLMIECEKCACWYHSDCVGQNWKTCFEQKSANSIAESSVQQKNIQFDSPKPNLKRKASRLHLTTHLVSEASTTCMESASKSNDPWVISASKNVFICPRCHRKERLEIARKRILELERQPEPRKHAQKLSKTEMPTLNTDWSESKPEPCTAVYPQNGTDVLTQDTVQKKLLLLELQPEQHTDVQKLSKTELHSEYTSRSESKPGPCEALLCPQSDPDFTQNTIQETQLLLEPQPEPHKDVQKLSEPELHSENKSWSESKPGPCEALCPQSETDLVTQNTIQKTLLLLQPKPEPCKGVEELINTESYYLNTGCSETKPKACKALGTQNEMDLFTQNTIQKTLLLLEPQPEPGKDLQKVMKTGLPSVSTGWSESKPNTCEALCPESEMDLFTQNTLQETLLLIEPQQEPGKDSQKVMKARLHSVNTGWSESKPNTCEALGPQSEMDLFAQSTIQKTLLLLEPQPEPRKDVQKLSKTELLPMNRGWSTIKLLPCEALSPQNKTDQVKDSVTESETKMCLIPQSTGDSEASRVTHRKPRTSMKVESAQWSLKKKQKVCPDGVLVDGLQQEARAPISSTFASQPQEELKGNASLEQELLKQGFADVLQTLLESGVCNYDMCRCLDHEFWEALQTENPHIKWSRFVVVKSFISKRCAEIFGQMNQPHEPAEATKNVEAAVIDFPA